MTAWVTDWLLAFGTTLVVELAIVLAILRAPLRSLWPHLLRRPPRKSSPAADAPRPGRIIAAVALANLATHPLVWFLFPGLTLPYLTRVVLSEIFAVAIEAPAYSLTLPRLAPRRALLMSLLANGASLLLGWGLRVLH